MKKTYLSPVINVVNIQPQLMQTISAMGTTDAYEGNLSRRGRWLSEEWDDYKERHSGELFEDEEFDY